MSPTRRPGTPPAVTIDVSPAYELLDSIVTASLDGAADTYEIGREWIAEAHARAGEELLERIGAEPALSGRDHLLALADEAQAADRDGFLAQGTALLRQMQASGVIHTGPPDLA